MTVFAKYFCQFVYILISKICWHEAIYFYSSKGVTKALFKLIFVVVVFGVVLVVAVVVVVVVVIKTDVTFLP